MGKITKEIKIGNIAIGGGHKVIVQTMTNTKTENIKGTIDQIRKLEDVGCEIVRVAVPTMEAAEAIRTIKKSINIPLVADIHFDYRLALASIENGADKIRINPGNLGGNERLKKVVESAKDRKIPIRVGVNSGSVEREFLEKYGGPKPEAMVESAIKNVRMIEQLDYDQIVISIKSSNVMDTIEAYKMISNLVDYPLHIGITEAGTIKKGTIKSSIGIGCLLYQGIGDTIRVSLTGDPREEIMVANEILTNLGLLDSGIEIVSCPTCGRCSVDLINIAEEVDRRIENLKAKKKVKVAVMGCGVNGPGEAKDADIGIAGGKGEYLLFIKGEPIKKVDENEAVDVLIEEIKHIISC
ncbi:flavodoxin-dependent (E)-4-hydroxy-3-methylbut-2-enyl-diphosphate synthase [Lutispora thermophila]|uniref:4-hydroxy-3-methylbut-2-en-1-yl diphosphate synthase (flavodoxin) n=1 Tax=Lutispora thermophila DSM 19022 TaxID=1122184 RepID=A0A1M6I4M2_9FIRM|nr:4-hydroxy-3-methylbut-2-en-1-yl diphosphate synthase [Lutispora thermophila DSM 19022]